MKFLTIKLRRDIQKNWRQFFSVFLMALLSVLVFVGLQGAYNGLGNSINSFINNSNLPNSWVYSTGFTTSEINSIKAIKSVSTVVKRTELNVSVVNYASEETYLTLDSQDNSDFSTSYLVKGQKFDVDNQGGVWLNKEYVLENHLNLGETVSIKINNKIVSLKLLGTIQSAERIYYTGTMEFIAPNYKSYGYGLISDKTLKQVLGYQGLPNVLELKNGSTDIRSNLLAILGNQNMGYYDRETLNSVATATLRVGQIRNLSVLFSFIFILLAILAMYTTIRRLIENQTKEIATLKAIGFSNRSIGIHYVSFGLVIGISGVIAGILLSPLISLFVLQSQKQQFSLPDWGVSYGLSSLFVMLLVVVICIISAYFAARQAIQGMPAEFLRGSSVKNAKNTLLEHFPKLWSHLSFENRWAIRDTSIHKSRIIMGIVGVAGGLMLLIAGIGMPNSINHLVNQAYTVNFTYDKRLNTPDYLSLKNKNLEQWVQISEGTYSKDDGHNRLFIVLGAGNFVNVKTEDGQGVKDGGIYITHSFAQYAHIHLGDRLSVHITGSSKAYSFKVKGILTSETNQGGYLTQKTFEEAGGTFFPQTLLANKNETLPSADITSTITMQQQKSNAQMFVNNLMGIFMLIIVFAILLVVVVLYNLGSLSFVERTRDYATLRVLGFHERELRRITMTENIITTFIGWLIGVPLGLLFLGAYVGTFTTIQLEYTPYISWGNLALASLIVWIASLSTLFLIGRRIRRLDMIEALKGVD